MSHNPLGQSNSYQAVSAYSAEVLFAIPRAENRRAFDFSAEQGLPFSGYDRWNAYEFSWLNKRSLPQVAHLVVDVPCDSEAMFESKSFKLYLNGFNFERFDSQEHVLQTLRKDLEHITQSTLLIQLFSVHAKKEGVPRVYEDQADGSLTDESEGIGLCIEDRLAHEDFSTITHVSKDLLSLENSSERPSSITETLHSHVFRSICPVTSQPDWASIVIRYEGAPISQLGLLRYLIAFREHQGFHEDCVERIFWDIKTVCQPEKLSVYAAFLRRGGIDINPLRADYECTLPQWRFPRQ